MTKKIVPSGSRVLTVERHPNRGIVVRRNRCLAFAANGNQCSLAAVTDVAVDGERVAVCASHSRALTKQAR